MLRRWFEYIRWYLDAARLLSVVLLGSNADEPAGEEIRDRHQL